MTLAELRARLRAELGDQTAGAYVWGDALLDAFLGDATERLGEDAPLEREAQLAAAPDGAYNLPADLVRVHAVERGGGALQPGEYAAWGGRLRLQAPSTAPVVVRYAAARPRPPLTGDAGLRAGEELPVLWLAAACAMEWLAKQREKAGSSAATGADAVAGAYRQRYDGWLAARRRPLRRRVLERP